MSSSKIRDSSLPSTIRRDLFYIALTGIILAVMITVYNNL